MIKMENKIKMLIAVGASVTANCQPCLQTAVSQAHKIGIGESEIREAMAIARVVRRGATSKMDRFCGTIIGKNITDDPDDCPFGSTEEDMKQWVNQNDQCGCDQPEQEGKA
jgi:AhpD family alkylhydroperoxidase